MYYYLYYIFCFILFFNFKAFAGKQEAVFYSQELFRNAETFFKAENYDKALSLYQRVVPNHLNQGDQFLLAFRLTDAQWRSQLKLGMLKYELLEKTRFDLNTLIHHSTHQSFGDQNSKGCVYESLGDAFWLCSHFIDKEQAIFYYQKALDVFGDSFDVIEAKTHYFLIFEKILFCHASPLLLDDLYFLNALKIAQTPREKSLATYGLAKVYLAKKIFNPTRFDQDDLVVFYLDQAYQFAKNESFFVRIGFDYVQWLQNQFLTMQKSDHPFDGNSLFLIEKLYQELLAIPHIEKDPCYSEIIKSLSLLKEPYLELEVPVVFVNGAQASCLLKSHFIDAVELSLYRIDLTKDLNFLDRDVLGSVVDDWAKFVDISKKTPTLIFELNVPEALRDFGYTFNLNFPEPLDKGVYLIKATGNGCEAKAVLMVSEMMLVMEGSSKNFLIYASNALTGEPMPNVAIKAYVKFADSGSDEGIFKSFVGQTNAKGCVDFELPMQLKPLYYFVGAFAPNLEGAYLISDQSGVKDYLKANIVTDRSLYFKKDCVEWFLFVEGGMKTSEELFYVIQNEHDLIVDKKLLQLSNYGGAHGHFDLTDELDEGPYYFSIQDRYGYSLIEKKYLFDLTANHHQKVAFTLNAFNAFRENKFHFLEKENITIEGELRSYSGFGFPDTQIEVSVYQYDMNNRKLMHSDACIHKDIIATSNYGDFFYQFQPPILHKNKVYDFVFKLISGDHVIMGIKTIVVTPETYFVSLSTDTIAAFCDESFNIHISIKDVFGKGLETEGKLMMVNANESSKILLEKLLKTNEEGDANLTLNIHEPGYYIFKWLSLDEQDLEGEADLFFWVLSNDGNDDSLCKKFSKFDVLINEDNQESASMLFQFPEKVGHVLVAFVGERILSWDIFEPQFFLEKKSFLLNPDWETPMNVHISWIHDCLITTRILPLRIKGDDARCNIKVDGLKTTYFPGESASFTIVLEGEDQKNIEGELSVAIKKKNNSYFSNGMVTGSLDNTMKENEYLVSHSFSQKRYCMVLGEIEDQSTFVSECLVVKENIFKRHPVSLFSSKGFQYLRELPLVWLPNVGIDGSKKFKIDFKFPECIDEWELIILAKNNDGKTIVLKEVIKTEAPVDLDIFAPAYLVEGDLLLVGAEIKNCTNEQQSMHVNLKDDVHQIDSHETMVLSGGSEVVLPYWIKGFQFPAYRFEMQLLHDAFQEKKGIDFFVLRQGDLQNDYANAYHPNGNIIFNYDLNNYQNYKRASFFPVASCSDMLIHASGIVSKINFNCAESIASYLFFCESVNQSPNAKNILSDPFINDQAVALSAVNRLMNLQNEEGGWAWFLKGDSDLRSTAYIFWMLSQCPDFASTEMGQKILKKTADYVRKKLNDATIAVGVNLILFSALVYYDYQCLKQPIQRSVVDEFVKFWNKRNGLDAFEIIFLMHTANAIGLSEEALLLANRLLQLFSKDIEMGQEVNYLKATKEASSLALSALSLLTLLELPLVQFPIDGLLNFFCLNRQGPAWPTERLSLLIMAAIAKSLNRVSYSPSVLICSLKLNNHVLDQSDFNKGFHVEFDNAMMEPFHQELRFEVSANQPIFCSSVIEHEVIVKEKETSDDPCHVERYYNRLLSKPTLLGHCKEVKKRLSTDAIIYSGEMIEVILWMQVKSPLHHVQFIEPIPAGCSLCGDVEYFPCLIKNILPADFDALRLGLDSEFIASSAFESLNYEYLYEGNAFLLAIDRLPPGDWMVRYRLRAENPGLFHVKSLQMHLWDEGFVKFLTPVHRLRIVDGSEASLRLPDF